MIRKKLTAILLAVLLVSCSTFSNMHTIHARASAASSALSLESTMEFTMLLYSLLESGMILSGIKEGVDDYNAGKSIYSAFQRFLLSAAPNPFEAFEGCAYTESDGTVVTYRKNDIYVVRPDGSIYTIDNHTLALEEYALPETEEDFNKFRVIEGGKNNPVPPEKNPFNKIQSAVISAGFVAVIEQFIDQLGNHELPDPDGSLWEYSYPDTIFSAASASPDPVPGTTAGWNVPDLHGSYRVTGYCYGKNNNGYLSRSYFGEFPESDRNVRVSVSPGLVVGYIDNYYSSAPRMYFLYRTSSLTSYNVQLLRTIEYHLFSGSYPEGFYTVGQSFWCGDGFRVNVPVFKDKDCATNFLMRGITDGLINGSDGRYNYSALTDAISDELSPLVGVSINPVAVPVVTQELKDAVKEIPEPAPDSDPAVNNDTYQDVVSDAVNNTVEVYDPQPAPQPEPLPEPVPEPGTEPDSETSSGIDSYKVDLTMIFPFCLPFDLMRLLEALSADPEAPCFHFPFVVPSLGIDMVVDIDLAFLDSVMEIFRAGILITFIIGLIYSTSKLIRW